MKINKSFLSKIIKEEIKRALYEEDPSWAKPVIHLFIQINKEIGQSNPDTETKEKYIKDIENLTGQKIADVFYFLKDKIDNDLYRNVAQLLNGEVASNLFADFDDNITPASYKTTDPKRTPMDDVRPPRIEPQDQEDTRKDRFGKEKKNWVH